MAKKKTKRKAPKRKATTRRRASTSGSRSTRSTPRKPSKALVKKTVVREGIGSTLAIGSRVLIDRAKLPETVSRDVVDGVQAGGGLLTVAAGYALNSPQTVTIGAHQTTAAASGWSARTSTTKRLQVANEGAQQSPMELFRDGLMTSGLPRDEAESWIAQMASPEVAGPIGLSSLLKLVLNRLQKGGAEQARAAQDLALAASGYCSLDSEGYACTETGRLRDRLGAFKKARQAKKGWRGNKPPSAREERRAEKAAAKAKEGPAALPAPVNDAEAERMIRELDAIIS